MKMKETVTIRLRINQASDTYLALRYALDTVPSQPLKARFRSALMRLEAQVKEQLPGTVLGVEGL